MGENDEWINPELQVWKVLICNMMLLGWYVSINKSQTVSSTEHHKILYSINTENCNKLFLQMSV
jgi:hypothetical protein